VSAAKQGDVAVGIVRLQDDAMRAGLIRTAHALNLAAKIVGYERAVLAGHKGSEAELERLCERYMSESGARP
jgi:hypothetical protein